MPVRNGVLARATSAGAPGSGTIGTVPVTDSWLIKSILLQNTAGVAVMLSIWVQGGAGPQIGALYSKSLAAGALDNVQIWVAAGPGDTLNWSFDQNGVHIWVSGADLPGHL